MKLDSLIFLTKREEIHEYVRTLWRTEEFQQSHDEKGYIWSIVEEFAKLPRLFYRMSDPHLETAHFSTWWNAIANHDYDNGGISDVYYQHEITHAARMLYGAEAPWNKWYTKMVTNEFDASLETEVIVYLMLPGLRGKTFQHEIWADRFLNDATYTTAFSKDTSPGPMQASRIDDIRARRKKAMTTPDPFDFLELQIANYLENNLEWARIWRSQRNVVESHMVKMVTTARVEGRESAVALHRAFIAQHALTQGADGIPFRRQAEQFSKVYWAGKETFGNKTLE